MCLFIMIATPAFQKPKRKPRERGKGRRKSEEELDLVGRVLAQPVRVERRAGRLSSTDDFLLINRRRSSGRRAEATGEGRGEGQGEGGVGGGCARSGWEGEATARSERGSIEAYLPHSSREEAKGGVPWNERGRLKGSGRTRSRAAAHSPRPAWPESSPPQPSIFHS